MEQPYMLPILYCQYHDWWCPGDLRSQGINSHGTCITQISQNISSLAQEDLTYSGTSKMAKINFNNFSFKGDRLIFFLNHWILIRISLIFFTNSPIAWYQIAIGSGYALATIHYLIQCLSSSLMRIYVTGSQCIKNNFTIRPFSTLTGHKLTCPYEHMVH